MLVLLLKLTTDKTIKSSEFDPYLVHKEVISIKMVDVTLHHITLKNYMKVMQVLQTDKMSRKIHYSSSFPKYHTQLENLTQVRAKTRILALSDKSS